ncbi:hypothetical protein B0T26DRAFT_489054 [Lasiosphaeria miniovina]|uniref:Uncharacterized protein n=1 Tax=Lasiosphaeria miniovina TaxID=1954250 RepID=A0AA39ZSY7_9PEZI|nr:uncharacterized protein B0T26DRAFT_489054 [Lasiosphaeria miniovina]KAK0703047.1 hypothetical protein B0T26DRAFT_489054 [Lasiosphaeria miniovina]
MAYETLDAGRGWMTKNAQQHAYISSLPCLTGIRPGSPTRGSFRCRSLRHRLCGLLHTRVKLDSDEDWSYKKEREASIPMAFPSDSQHDQEKPCRQRLVPWRHCLHSERDFSVNRSGIFGAPTNCSSRVLRGSSPREPAGRNSGVASVKLQPARFLGHRLPSECYRIERWRVLALNRRPRQRKVDGIFVDVVPVQGMKGRAFPRRIPLRGQRRER